MGKLEVMKSRGWFSTEGREGDRTLEQQMIGLDLLLSEVSGKTVLDAGCAEGLISMELVRAGAANCVGLEIVTYHVDVGRKMIGDLPCTIHLANLNTYDVAQHGQFDIVLMLAILHKVKNPSQLCADLAALARDLCVIRLPPKGLVIVDARSDNAPHDIGAVMDRCGFYLEGTVIGPLNEWLGYFRRRVKIEPETKAPEPETAVAEAETLTAQPETATVETETQPAEAPEQAEVHESHAPRTRRARRARGE